MTTMDVQPELIERAKQGDRAALEDVVRATKDLVYNLAIRMLGSPADAEDATQEILLKLVTHLSSFRGESAFRTWAYRVASNHLLTTRKRGAEQRTESFDELGTLLASHLGDRDTALEDEVLVQEAKLICTSTMLACLDRDHRLAYILGEIFELPGEEAAAILEISGEAYRKRVSRARSRMEEFMSRKCGLVESTNPCRCGKQAAYAVRAGALDPACPSFARVPRQQGRARLDDLDQLSRAIAVFRSHPTYIAPDALVTRLRQALDAGRSDLLR